MALGLANFVPGIIKLFTGSDQDAAVAQKVVSIAQTVTGKGSGDEALAAIQENPQLALQLQAEVDRHAEEMAKIAQVTDLANIKADSDAITNVNTTMQAEAANSANENWWQKGWRPFNGYVVGLGALIGVCVTCWLFYQALINKDVAALNLIPQLATSLTLVLSIPGAAVGITAWHRGMLQREAAKGSQ